MLFDKSHFGSPFLSDIGPFDPNYDDESHLSQKKSDMERSA
jgi:hypothetical protein